MQFRNCQNPKTESELRGFLGIVGYYRRFVENFAKIAAPRHALLGGTGKKERRARKLVSH